MRTMVAQRAASRKSRSSLSDYAGVTRGFNFRPVFYVP